jgi:hypothetical protein
MSEVAIMSVRSRRAGTKRQQRPNIRARPSYSTPASWLFISMGRATRILPEMKGRFQSASTP